MVFKKIFFYFVRVLFAALNMPMINEYPILVESVDSYTDRYTDISMLMHSICK